MIQRVSIPNNSTSSFKKNKQAVKTVAAKQINTAKPYVDSFVKNAKKSTPAIASLTAFWTLVDKSSKNISFSKSLTNNIKGFFIPVVVGSSVLLSLIENKKSSRNHQEN